VPRPLRYTFILALVALGTAMAAVGGWRYARASAPVSGPIILISVDTLRADRLAAYGYRAGRTPAIDSLARDGIVFERAYSHASLTLPAHASLMSGRLPFDTGVRDNAGFAVKNGERLLAEILRDRGYATGAVVSSYVLRRDTGIAQGFEFFDDAMPAAADTFAARLYRSGAESERVAENWLGSIGTSRAFLFLHLYEPHGPHPAIAPDTRDPYDVEVTGADEVIGRLTRYLKAHQLYDQSTIILVSDHGAGLGDHGEQDHGLFVYEEAVRVPLIVKPAAGLGAGRRIDGIAQHVDLVPTILDLANAPVPDNLRGRSLKGVLEGVDRLDERHVYSESMYARYRFGWSELASVTDGRYRYIRAPQEELYDLQRDPAQRDNLAPRDIRKTETLRSALDRIVGTTGSPEARAEVLPEDLERLHALGYVGAGEPAAAADGSEPRRDPKEHVEILETYRAAAQAQFAGRLEEAASQYRSVLASEPDDRGAHLFLASTLVRLRRFDEARAHALRAALLTPASDRRQYAAARALLVRIALARRDGAAARAEARLAAEADPSQPFTMYVNARLLLDQGRSEEAAALFEKALAASAESDRPVIPDLNYFAGEAFAREDRLVDAERAYLAEIAAAPDHYRARGSLASLYHDTARTGLAAEQLNEMVRLAPMPEAYSLAARLWTSFGYPREAAAVRAEARQPAPPPAASRDGQQ
jgi:arylsulfatase A-like enzyme/thioredoxin-like negative regulator of GroEL